MKLHFSFINWSIVTLSVCQDAVTDSRSAATWTSSCYWVLARSRSNVCIMHQSVCACEHAVVPAPCSSVSVCLHKHTCAAMVHVATRQTCAHARSLSVHSHLRTRTPTPTGTTACTCTICICICTFECTCKCTGICSWSSTSCG